MKASSSWALAPKTEIDPSKVIAHDSDQLGKVMVAFALAYNDLKGMVLFEKYLLDEGRPQPGDFSERAGQWRGCAVQIHRWVAGVIHELMVVIADNKDLLRSKIVEALVAKLGDDNRRAWRDLYAAATRASGTKTATMLLRIRNSAAFHYGAKDSGLGFKRQFVESARAEPSAANATAQYSVGKDMDATRFYFADAVAQQRFMMLGHEFGATETDKRVVELAADMNRALQPLIVAFLESRR